MKNQKEILKTSIEVSMSKASNTTGRILVLAFLAGVFIAFGAEGSTMAAYNLLSDPSTYGIGRLVSGILFTPGLMMVVLAGAELFTGDMLMVTGLADRKISFSAMLKVMILAYIGNFIGSVFVAWLMNMTGIFGASSGSLGAMVIKIGIGKVNLGFTKAFILGIFCNWLVCLAVWMAFGATSAIGKIAAIFFPICLFVTSGFEHSIANMYYIPAAIFAKGNLEYLSAGNFTPQAIDSLTWGNFLGGNLLPVTLGNIVGGAFFVGMAYYYAYSSKKN